MGERVFYVLGASVAGHEKKQKKIRELAFSLLHVSPLDERVQRVS